MTGYFLAHGKVQGVMFRQTIIRGAQKRGLAAGATNLPGGTEVAITLSGDEAAIDEIMEAVRELKPLNSWGASVVRLEAREEGLSLGEHQVTTENVGNYAWNPNIDMFL